MARLNINISDNLDEKMREYIQDNDLTITTFLHLAITKYIESQEQAKRMKELFVEFMKEELKNER